MIAALLTLSGCSTTDASTVEATAKEGVTEQSIMLCSVGNAEKYVAKQLGLTVTGSGYGAYRNALITANILQENELEDTKKNINKAELALLAARTMTYKGEKEDTDLSEIIVSKKRISDLSKIEEPYKSCVVQVFGEGVMVGSSNGTYSQSRTFKANDSVATGTMKSVIKKAIEKKGRNIMSSDGQLTRTTNLPKKAKRYKYILASFPNSFYDLGMEYDHAVYSGTPTYMKDYCFPKDLMKLKYDTWNEILDFSDMYDKYGDTWMNKVKNNLQYRLNFNYKTVDEEWVKGLASTYYIAYDQTENPRRIAAIKDYVKTAKKNKVIIQADKVVVEPSTLYMGASGFYVRCYVRFKVSADEIFDCMSNEQHKMIYCGRESMYLKLKNGIYYEGVFDIGISTSAGGDNGHGFSVSDDSLIDWAKA